MGRLSTFQKGAYSNRVSRTCLSDPRDDRIVVLHNKADFSF